MRVSTFAALALAPAAFAQSSSASASASASGSSSGNSTAGAAYLQQVLGALEAANLTSLVNVTTAVANTTAGMALLGQLANGNKTVFAPNNDAFANVSSDVASNPDLLAQILSYHILNSTFTANNTAVGPNHTIARTFLSGGNYSLPGNRTAPVVLELMSSNATQLTVVEATSNVTSVGSAAAANLMIYVIPQVLSLPMSISSTVGSLAPALAQVASPLLAPLDAAMGVTVFAPSDSAVNAAMSALGSLNATQIQTILLNHVINGTVAYSTNLGSGNYTSAAGEPFTFMSNSSGTYVMSANSTAKVIKSDIIVQNGVVHVIDGILVNTMSNAAAAASAYSAGQAGASSTDNASPATSSASASGSKAAAGVVASLNWANSMVGGVIAVVGVMLGGGYVLA